MMVIKTTLAVINALFALVFLSASLHDADVLERNVYIILNIITVLFFVNFIAMVTIR